MQVSRQAVVFGQPIDTISFSTLATVPQLPGSLNTPLSIRKHRPHDLLIRYKQAAKVQRKLIAMTTQAEDQYNTQMKHLFPEVDHISARELRALMDDPAHKVVLLDVRTSEERAVSQIPGAPLLSAEQFAQRQEEFRDCAIICYCTVGYRSGKMAQRLRREGFRALNLPGSIIAWVQEGYPLHTEAGEETKTVHVFMDKFAAGMPSGYTAVAFGNFKGLVEMARTALPKQLGGTV